MFKISYFNCLVFKPFLNNCSNSRNLLKSKHYSKILTFKRFAMDLASVVQTFESVVPPKLAEEWDNTGLLIEPLDKKLITTILFTNDLTENVMKEALSTNANLIISYHPPIFAPVKSLRMFNWKDRIVMECVKNSIAVYSPHTACDAVQDGVNDWLINCFDLSHSHPIKQSNSETDLKYSYKINFSSPILTEINQELSHFANINIKTGARDYPEHVEVLVDKNSITDVLKVLTCKNNSSVSVSQVSPQPPLPSHGMGRIGKLQSPAKLKDCIEIVKNHLKLNNIRLAMANGHSLDTEISTVAVCAGSGSSILKNVAADLYVTGEMSHHDLLDITHKNISVILSEHSNSERGYLQKLMDVLNPKLPGIKLITSFTDKDPILIV